MATGRCSDRLRKKGFERVRSHSKAELVEYEKILTNYAESDAKENEEADASNEQYERDDYEDEEETRAREIAGIRGRRVSNLRFTTLRPGV